MLKNDNKLREIRNIPLWKNGFKKKRIGSKTYLNPFHNLKLFMQSHNQLMPQFVASILKLNFLKIVLNTCTKIILPSLNTFIRAKLVFVPFSIVMIMSSVLRGICTPYKPTLVSGCSWKFCQTFTFHPKIFKLNREVQ